LAAAVKGMGAAFAANFPKGNCRVDLIRTHVRGRAGERAGSPQLTFCGADMLPGGLSGPPATRFNPKGPEGTAESA
jgi:hypothetical protein